jgi:predicted nucleotide-binding protein (sugar kinase/HSP70/actin superfamily)
LQGVLKACRQKGFKENIQAIVSEFEAFDITDQIKPKVGLVGEILVKFHPTANNNVVSLVEAEGAEAVMPGLTDFLLYCAYDADYKYKYLSGSKLSQIKGLAAMKGIEFYLSKVYRDALKDSTRFYAPKPIDEVARGAATVLDLGHQTGEGCFKPVKWWSYQRRR